MDYSDAIQETLKAEEANKKLADDFRQPTPVDTEPQAQ